ncbi:phage major capsid protein, partial [Streptomyces sp. A73]|nr:phage major capsid protein [Streptomyces sp. A73]
RRQSTSVDSGLRAIGGDYSQAAYGVGMEISIKLSREATSIDEDGAVHSAFQENLVLLLAEAYYGFVLGDAEAFVKFTGTPS